MKYILGVGILYKPYKKTCKIQIFSDDILIDEFELDKKIKANVYKRIHPVYDPSSLDSYKKFVEHRDINELEISGGWKSCFPEKVRLYEIDESILNKDIVIKIENNDNNYTNGFMTKMSMIQPRFIFIIPKNLFYYNKLLKLADEQTKLLNSRKKGNHSFYAERGKVDIIFPVIEWLYLTKNDKEELIGKTNWIGGTAKLRLPLKKIKGTTLYPKLTKNIFSFNHSEQEFNNLPCSYPFLTFLHRLQKNKYKKHENT